MLVLTRRVGEQIIIDENIRLEVLEVRGGKVRLGLEAPPSVRIDRMEIHHKRAEQPVRRQAALAVADLEPVVAGVSAPH